MRAFATTYLRKCGIGVLLAVILSAFVTPALAQKNKTTKKDQQTDADAQADLNSMMPVSDSEAVDRAVGEALGYWQIGDVDSLHKYYSNDVVMVSGTWEPPVIGWDNFLKAYQAQRASVTGGRVDRSNTYIKVNGTSAWATYQFVYTAMAGDKVIQFHGHTTLILNKQADRWVIVLNHSSIVDSTASNPEVPANSAQSGRP